MRRPTVVLLAVLAIGLMACSEQPPEVNINDQVPADQQVAEVAPGSEGEEGAAEGGGGEADFASADSVWVAENLEFTSAPDTMPADGAVIGLEVVGGLPHDVTFEGVQGDSPLVVGPGEGEFASQVSIPAGTYTYYCSVVGHRAAGMEGSITVE